MKPLAKMGRLDTCQQFLNISIFFFFLPLFIKYVQVTVLCVVTPQSQ